MTTIDEKRLLEFERERDLSDDARRSGGRIFVNFCGGTMQS